MAVKAFRVLGCSGVSRIDFMIDASTGKVWLNIDKSLSQRQEIFVEHILTRCV